MAGGTGGDAGWWAADPTGRHQFRYWNGVAWTEWVHDDGPPLVDPSGPPWPHVSAKRPAPKVFARDGIVVALTGIVVSAVGARLVAGSVASFSSAGAGRVALFYAILYGGLVATCVVASGRYGTGHVRADFGVAWRGRDLGWGVLTFIVTSYGTSFIVAFLVSGGALHDSATRYSDRVKEITGGALAIWVIVGVLVAPIVEEMVFRGLLLRSLIPAVGVNPAIALQAVAFGAYHFAPGLGLYNIVYFISTALFGVVAGAIAARQDRLGITITAHLLTNAFLFAVVAATR